MSCTRCTYLYTKLMLSIILHTVCDLFCSSQFRHTKKTWWAFCGFPAFQKKKQTGQVTLASIPLEGSHKTKRNIWGHFPPAISGEFFSVLLLLKLDRAPSQCYVFACFEKRHFPPLWSIFELFSWTKFRRWVGRVLGKS